MWNWSEKTTFTLYRFEEVIIFTILLDFSKSLFEENRWNLHYKFAFAGECEVDEGGVSPEFYSGNVDDSCLLITEAFPGDKFEIY